MMSRQNPDQNINFMLAEYSPAVMMISQLIKFGNGNIESKVTNYSIKK